MFIRLINVFLDFTEWRTLLQPQEVDLNKDSAVQPAVLAELVGPVGPEVVVSSLSAFRLIPFPKRIFSI